MDSFIKKIFDGKTDEKVHQHFVRFGKGEFQNKAALKLWKTSKIKIGGSFEYADDFVELVSELQDLKFSGLILSKEALEIEKEKKKSCLFAYEVQNIGSQEIKKIKDKAYFMLLDAEGSGISLKIKKKIPKPGKSSEAKVDDKFCQIEADLKFWPAVKEAFFWDLPDCKKAAISHSYIIENLIFPEGEKDFEKIRLMAKRKGKIIRKLEFDGKQERKEKEIEV